jgi:hypothetical protein
MDDFTPHYPQSARELIVEGINETGGTDAEDIYKIIQVVILKRQLHLLRFPERIMDSRIKSSLRQKGIYGPKDVREIIRQIKEDINGSKGTII